MPCEFVWVVTGEPVGGVITTVALVTMAPDGSVTCPRRTPEADWADESSVNNNSKKKMVIKRPAYLKTLIPRSTSPKRISAHTTKHRQRGRHTLFVQILP